MKLFNTIVFTCALFTLACSDDAPSDTQSNDLMDMGNGSDAMPSFDPMDPRESQDEPSEPDTPDETDPVEEPEARQSPVQIDFNLEGYEDLELNSGVVFEELCEGDDTATLTILVMTPWQMNCDGPAISEAPDKWTAVAIVLEDGCGFDPLMETASQTTEVLDNGSVFSEFRQNHTHDVRIQAIERQDATDEIDTATVSVEVDIFERFQAQGGNVIGSLRARLPDCGAKMSVDDEAWWRPAVEDEWP